MIGVIGCGNMGKAMIQGIVKGSIVKAEEIWIFDSDRDKSKKLADDTGVNIAHSEIEVVNKSSYIILAVKPIGFKRIFDSISDLNDTGDKVLISIAAGLTLDSIDDMCDGKFRVFRVMPNIPVLVGSGMSAISYEQDFSAEEIDFVMGIFNCFGIADIVDESLMDVVVGISGSSPAFIFMMIEAMADGAVLGGMSRDKAYKYAAQTLMGSAKLILETGTHPGALKDMVCSPGGTSIEGVKVLEETGFRASVMKAIISASDKSRKMGE